MAAPRPLAALRFRDLRALRAGRGTSHVGTRTQPVAIRWHVCLLTASPLALGLVSLARPPPRRGAGVGRDPLRAEKGAC